MGRSGQSAKRREHASNKGLGVTTSLRTSWQGYPTPLPSTIAHIQKSIKNARFLSATKILYRFLLTRGRWFDVCRSVFLGRSNRDGEIGVRIRIKSPVDGRFRRQVDVGPRKTSRDRHAFVATRRHLSAGGK